MKNVITLDTEEGLVPELTVISSVENAIYFRIYNPGTSAKLEVYYGCDYKKTLPVTTKDIQIPTEYVSDAGMIHVRYVDAATESKFVHVLGNENLYKELKLEKRTTYLYSCAGAKKDRAESERNHSGRISGRVEQESGNKCSNNSGNIGGTDGSY